MPPRLVLASASPARLRLLRDSGFDPEVIVSGVDETTVEQQDTASQAQQLARAKAATVADRLTDEAGTVIVLGCDSLLDLDGQPCGKPVDDAQARARWDRMAGRDADLVTGHSLLRLDDGRVAARAEATVRTTVHFAAPDDEELTAYLASGEPLLVAGGFTLDGRGAMFVRGVTGCPSNVVGVSLPTVRTLLAEVEVAATALWTVPACC